MASRNNEPGLPLTAPADFMYHFLALLLVLLARRHVGLLRDRTWVDVLSCSSCVSSPKKSCIGFARARGSSPMAVEDVMRSFEISMKHHAAEIGIFNGYVGLHLALYLSSGVKERVLLEIGNQLFQARAHFLSAYEYVELY